MAVVKLFVHDHRSLSKNWAARIAV